MHHRSMTKHIYRLTGGGGGREYLAVATSPEGARGALAKYNGEIDPSAVVIEEVASQKTLGDATILGADRIVYVHPRNDLYASTVGGWSPLHGIGDPIRFLCRERLGRLPNADEDRHYLAVKIGGGHVWLWKGDAFAFADRDAMLWGVPGGKLVD